MILLQYDSDSNDNLIEFVLRHADQIRKCVEEKKLDSGAGHDNNVGGSHSRISDPTSAQALHKVEPVGFIHCPYGPAINGKRDTRYIKLPEKWLTVERLTKDFYTRDAEREVVREIYTRRYLQGEYGERWEITCAKLKVSKTLYYVVVHDVIRFAGLYAAGLGVIAPYSRFK